MTHTTQGAKRGREQVEPVPDALYRHWFVLGGTLVSSRFAPSDADVLGAGMLFRRARICRRRALGIVQMLLRSASGPRLACQ